MTSQKSEPGLADGKERVSWLHTKKSISLIDQASTLAEMPHNDTFYRAGSPFRFWGQRQGGSGRIFNCSLSSWSMPIKVNRSMIEGFTKNTIAAMIEGVRKPTVAADLIEPDLFDKAVKGQSRTCETDGVSCCSVFRVLPGKF